MNQCRYFLSWQSISSIKVDGSSKRPTSCIESLPAKVVVRKRVKLSYVVSVSTKVQVYVNERASAWGGILDGLTHEGENIENQVRIV